MMSKYENIIPAEQSRSILKGLLVHFGPSFIYVIILYYFGLTINLAILGFLGLAVINFIVLILAEIIDPAIVLKHHGKIIIARGLAFVFLTGVGAGGAFIIAGRLFTIKIFGPEHQIGLQWLNIFLAILFTDCAYYFIHRYLSHGKLINWFRQKHKVHHGVAALDFLRGNISSFFDTAVIGFQVPLIIISTILRLNLAATITAYGLILLLQATHHVNHTFNLGIFRFIFMDNHAHKLHHVPRGQSLNLGALFSIWDRLFGTYYEDWGRSSGYLHKYRLKVVAKSL